MTSSSLAALEMEVQQQLDDLCFRSSWPEGLQMITSLVVAQKTVRTWQGPHLELFPWNLDTELQARRGFGATPTPPWPEEQVWGSVAAVRCSAEGSEAAVRCSAEEEHRNCSATGSLEVPKSCQWSAQVEQHRSSLAKAVAQTSYSVLEETWRAIADVRHRGRRTCP